MNSYEELVIEDLLKIAYANPGCSSAKMAAVIKDRKSTVSFGLNQMKTHPLQAKYGKNKHAICLHAEIDAIRNAPRDYDFRGTSLFVARSLKNGQSALAKPCSGCQRAIRDFGISRVYYTTEDGYNVWILD